MFRDPGQERDGAGNILCSGKLLVLLNAWDSVSYVGNGGSRDATVDGFLVAGFGPNVALRNSSYLHNPIFNPGLGDSATWVIVEE